MMTTLLIDAGNSRLKWALYSHGQLKPVESLSYQKPFQSSSLAEQFTSSWSSLLGSEKRPGKIIISNVAGQWVMDALQRWVKEQLDQGRTVKEEECLTIDLVVAQKHAFGVENGYQRPEMLGADRWAALVAARHLVDGDCCVIDCGSALTIDVLTKEGVHKGGTIAPGWKMMKNSLVQNTDAIEDAMIYDPQLSSGLLGKNTPEAIEAGVSAACAGAVAHVVQSYQDKAGVKLHCVLTGGCAEKLLPQLSGQYPAGTFQYEPDWVLKGLAIISDSTAENVKVKNAGFMK